MSTGEVTFVDTNVLVYAHDTADIRKQRIAQALLDDLWANGTGRLSTQVLQEFYAVATRKLAQPMPRNEAREVVAAYGAWNPILPDPILILLASELEERRQVSFWDALIVEAARRSGATRIVTEDLQDGGDFDGVRVENPFRERG